MYNCFYGSLLVFGLGLFAYDRILMIRDRSHVIQTKVVTAPPKTDYFGVYLPDFIFCTYVATPLYIDDRYKIETFDLQAVSQGKMVETPCWNGGGTPYKYMHVLMSKDTYINAADKNVDPRMRFTFEAKFNETDVSGVMLPIPSEERNVLVVIPPRISFPNAFSEQWNRAAFFVLPRSKLCY